MSLYIYPRDYPSLSYHYPPQSPKRLPLLSPCHPEALSVSYMTIDCSRVGSPMAGQTICDRKTKSGGAMCHM